MHVLFDDLFDFVVPVESLVRPPRRLQRLFDPLHGHLVLQGQVEKWLAVDYLEIIFHRLLLRPQLPLLLPVSCVGTAGSSRILGYRGIDH